MITTPVQITKKAAEQIKRIMLEKSLPASYGLRIGVEGGGCGRPAKNILGFDIRKEPDMAYSIRDINVYLDKRQIMFLLGMTIDYYRDEKEEGFIFINNKSNS